MFEQGMNESLTNYQREREREREGECGGVLKKGRSERTQWRIKKKRVTGEPTRQDNHWRERKERQWTPKASIDIPCCSGWSSLYTSMPQSPQNFSSWDSLYLSNIFPVGSNSSRRSQTAGRFSTARGNVVASHARTSSALDPACMTATHNSKVKNKYN